MENETKVTIETEEGQVITVKGIQGPQGERGAQGENGRDGTNGKDGDDGRDGRNGIDGRDGDKGKDGRDGIDGKDAVQIPLEDILKEVVKNTPEKGKIDQRWHGGGLSRVTTDTTLSGTGAPSSPLHVVGGPLTDYWKKDGSNGPATGDWNLGPHSLTVDTNVLFVDSIHNGVGMGIISPKYRLDVNEIGDSSGSINGLTISTIDDTSSLGGNQPNIFIRAGGGSPAGDIFINAGPSFSSGLSDGSTHINGGNNFTAGSVYIGDNQSGNTYLYNPIFPNTLQVNGIVNDAFNGVQTLEIFTSDGFQTNPDINITAGPGVLDLDGSINLRTSLGNGGGGISLIDTSGGGILLNALSSGAGIQIATASNQLIGFWGATPIAQPTTATTAATFVVNTGTAVNTGSTFDGYTLAKVVKALRNAGILA